MSVLAIDAGTAGVTALVVTADGTAAAEHEPEEIWVAALAAYRQVLVDAEGSGRRRAVARASGWAGG